MESAVFEGEDEPGRIHLCVKIGGSNCFPDLDTKLAGGEPSIFDEAHYLDVAELVYPLGRGAPPLLHLQFSSVPSGNGDQRRAAEIIAYRPDEHRFAVIFDEGFGRNNNQEIRYVRTGPLRGSMISVQSPYGPPFSYVITVHRLTPAYRYKQVLQYRSATTYGDGNPLAVIESEMPNILRRLGLWRLGQPLPLPASRCPRPHLVKTALWCA